MLRLARVLGVVLLAAVLFRTFAFEAFNIPSGSMMPTLLAGDEVLVSKFAYRIGPAGPAFWQNRVPARGDVVVFTPTNNPDADYIKRVIAVPGDRVQLIAGRVFLNGDPVAEERVGDFVDQRGTGTARIPQMVETLPGGSSHAVLKATDHAVLDDTPEWVVPPDHVFVLGDNRDASEDSRSMQAVGFVPIENLVGQAQLRLYSLADRTPWWAVWRWPAVLRMERVLTRVR